MGLDNFTSPRDSIETDAAHYSVVFDISLGEMRAGIYKGKNPWALLVDTTTGNIYVGDHHEAMRDRHHIPDNSLYEGNFRVDEDFQDAQLLFLAEWRKRPGAKVIEGGLVKSAIAEALKRDFMLKSKE